MQDPVPVHANVRFAFANGEDLFEGVGLIVGHGDALAGMKRRGGRSVQGPEAVGGDAGEVDLEGVYGCRPLVRWFCPASLYDALALYSSSASTGTWAMPSTIT